MLRMRLLAGLATISCTSMATAANYSDPGAIDTAVAHFTGAAIGEPGGARLPVDRRMKLERCETALTLEWHGNDKKTVLVRCPLLSSWRLFVPTIPTVTSNAKDKEAPLIMRGENITVSVNGKGFSLTRQGEALDNGSADEWIRVRIGGKRGEAMRARVLRPGAVGMNLQ